MIKKLKIFIWVLAVVFILPAGCWQEELFDLAKNGVPLVYAVVTTAASGANRVLMVTDGEDYYQENMLYDENTMMNITDTVTNIAVTQSGEVYIYTTSLVFYRSNHGLGYMKQLDPVGKPASVSWMAVYGDSLYVNDGSPTIFRYSEGWSSFTIPGTPSYMGKENGTGRLFFTYMAGTYSFYWINESSSSLAFTTTIAGGFPYFLSIVDDGNWIGADDKPYFKSVALSVPGSPPAINGYCRIGSSLYCIDSNLFLHKSNRARTDMFLFDPLPLPANPSFTYAFGDSKIAVSTGSPGYYLYFYNLEKKSCYVFNKNTSFTTFECMTVH